MDDMMGMGMDMDSMGPFTPENEYRAKIFWYIVAAVIGVFTLVRLAGWTKKTRPSGAIEQAFATSTAVYRELTYPQPIWFTGKYSKYFTPPSTGKWLLLAVYWLVVLVLLWSDVLIQPDDDMYPYRWEKVGFRAAWISVTQIPLIYLLSCKFNPISILTGISYERFNWLHRWSARTVFLTVIVHWSYFFYEWTLSDFVAYELKVMPMVKYGFGAWAVIGWMIVSGFGFFRAAAYELFVVQHIFAAATLLWLLYVHVPAYAAYNVWLSVGFVAFDWGVRIVLGLVRNIRGGYMARIEVSDVVKLTVDVDFKWKAGQHIQISIPSLRPFEVHPFTIANSAYTFDGQQRPLQLVIKAHAGFTKSLKEGTRRVFLSWPLGIPPDVSKYDTVVLAACSTGASFVVPILQDLVRFNTVRVVEMHWIVRQREHINWFEGALNEVLEVAQKKKMCLSISIHITRDDTNSLSSASMEKAPLTRSTSVQSTMSTTSGRPSIESIVRPAVEGAFGETAIVACGGLEFSAEMRTFVAALSDERAVHKGTGAQGIFLFTETYGW